MAFTPFYIDLERDSLWRGRQEIALEPKTYALLRYLVQRPRRLVDKRELLQALWGDVHVGQSVLKTQLARLRRALNDDVRSPRFIESVNRRGCRFIAPVTLCPTPPISERSSALGDREFESPWDVGTSSGWSRELRSTWGARSFRHLFVWQTGFQLCIDVYRATEAFPRNEQHGLAADLRRTSRSIPSNIAEGHRNTSTIERVRLFDMARGSAAELETQLLLSRALALTDERVSASLLHSASELERMLAVSIRELRQRSSLRLNPEPDPPSGPHILRS